MAERRRGANEHLRDALCQLFEASVSVSGALRAELEHLVRDLVLSGAEQRHERGSDLLEELRARSKRSADLLAVVWDDLHVGLGRRAERGRRDLDELVGRLGALLGALEDTCRRSRPGEGARSGRGPSQSLAEEPKQHSEGAAFEAEARPAPQARPRTAKRAPRPPSASAREGTAGKGDPELG